MKHSALFYSVTLLLYCFITIEGYTQSIKNVNVNLPLSSTADDLFSAWNNDSTPGISALVMKKGDVVYKRAFGLANLEYDIPITPVTIFHVASISKQFTAFSILLLQERGALSLEDDIRKHIPEVPDFGQTITLRHLITHTSGLRDQWNLLLLKGVRLDDVITQEHLLTLVSQQQELNFTPGSEYLYCNTGFMLLAEVVSRVSGLSFNEFCTQNIFTPLGMKNTMFNDDHEQIVKSRAHSYYKDQQVYKKKVLSYANVGATSLLTTAEDLGLWSKNYNSVQIGNKGIINQMTKMARLTNGDTFGGGMGLFMSKYKGIPVAAHGGADAGFRAQFTMYPTQDLTIIVLSNDGHCDTKQLVNQLSDLYIEDNDQTSEPSSNDKRPFVKLKPKDLEPFTGHYWSKEYGFTRNIYLKGDSLMHFRTENNESALAPYSKDEFKVLNVPPHVLITFESIDGEMVMFEKVNDGPTKRLEKYIPVQYTEQEWESLEGHYYSSEIRTSYIMEWNNDKLIAKHMRMGEIGLNIIKHDFFKGDRGFFGYVEFQRDKEGKINGFRVSNGRVRNLLFEKEFVTNR